MRIINLFGLVLLISGCASIEEGWNIGVTQEDGQRVIYRSLAQMPSENTRAKFQWLTVISWSYDGARNEGMPSIEQNVKMQNFEEAIITHVQGKNICKMVLIKSS